ncbi:type II toxin-antitoxin system VapB family antitoxin [Bosea sp. 685]|uniref:type II toxin-antitoxin system VapB family antitoxin n=1 Tax=Bosea sp. 685 TaxID=3080057 RepID=UPI002892F1CB|nr:type II toxin-antitoxin system VapB family antitoxin [Bosea sp. 685]WNJ89368.1 type II toxin-antitoxin system VapB family antitoxin [Bosea sp. 685]
MIVLIKDPETDQLIREMAAQTGETITQAVKTATKERLARLPRPARTGRLDRTKIDAFLAEIDALTKVDTHLSDEELIGYDEIGVPR